MRYVFYVLAFALIGVLWINNTPQGRKILHNVDAASERGTAQYRPH